MRLRLLTSGKEQRAAFYAVNSTEDSTHLPKEATNTAQKNTSPVK